MPKRGNKVQSAQPLGAATAQPLGQLLKQHFIAYRDIDPRRCTMWTNIRTLSKRGKKMLKSDLTGSTQSSPYLRSKPIVVNGKL